MNKERLNILWENIKELDDIKNEANRIKRESQIADYIEEILKINIDDLQPEEIKDMPLLYEIKTRKR